MLDHITFVPDMLSIPETWKLERKIPHFEKELSLDSFCQSCTLTQCITVKSLKAPKIEITATSYGQNVVHLWPVNAHLAFVIQCTHHFCPLIFLGRNTKWD